MKDRAPLRMPRGIGPSAQHLAARTAAHRQLEIADLYLAAAENVDLGEPSLLRLLGSIRGQVAEARRRLSFPPQL